MQKEPYSAPPDNLEGHKTADYVADVDYSFVTPPKHMDWDETFVSH
jgi:hypothetical protein